LGAYIIAAKFVPLKFHPLLFLAAFAMLVAAREYLVTHVDVLFENSDPFFLNGTDQFVLFGLRYAVLAYAVLAVLLTAFITDAVVERRALASRAVPIELYLLSLLTALWLPDAIMLPGYAAPLTLVTVRLTAVCAVLACLWFAMTRPRVWLVAGLCVGAVVYFGMVYQDTGTLSRAEDRVGQLVSGAAGQRVVLVVRDIGYTTSRIGYIHLADRACAGRCSSFSNYEPASRQFRVRAADGNGIVAAQYRDSW